MTCVLAGVSVADLVKGALLGQVLTHAVEAFLIAHH